MSNNYPVSTDAEDYFRQNEKRLMNQERRPQINRASDLLGPGIAAYATQIEHWNNPEATFNGMFWTEAGDTGAPDLTNSWIGQVTASSDGFGVQRIVTFRDSALFPPVTAVRQFFDPGNGTASYSAWRSQFSIAETDEGLSTVGDAAGVGPALINGDGTASIPGLQEPYMRRTRSANQSIPDAEATAVRQWSNVIADTPDWTYDNSTGVFTCTRGGTWFIYAVVKLNAGDSDAPYVARLWIERSGSNLLPGGTYNWDAGSDTYVPISGVVSFSAGGTMRLMAYINNAGGGNITTQGDSDSMFIMQRLSAP